jgi:carbonic anhydrase
MQHDYVSNLAEYEDKHFAEALILSCIDYRFVDDTIFFLEQNPALSQSYDVTALAGSSLGANQNKYPHWRQTFIDHVNLAIELHHIRQLIVFDHMDCGAYQMFYPDIKSNSNEERKLHIENIGTFIKNMRKLFPDLIYSGYLLHTDNTIEKIV